MHERWADSKIDLEPFVESGFHSKARFLKKSRLAGRDNPVRRIIFNDEWREQ